MLNELYFYRPYWILLSLLVLILIYIYFRFIYQRENVFLFSNNSFLAQVKPSIKRRLAIVPDLLRFLFLLALILALMQPRMGVEERRVNKYGIDIVLVLDISGSMEASDFKPNRISVAKKTAKEFITMRKNDRIGLVIFARNSFTQCPLTFDYEILTKMIDEVEIGMIEDGTAIGEALVTAENRLKDSKAKSKVIVLLTDGDNNAGEVDPITASKFAAELGIKIYAIGIGSPKGIEVPVPDPIYGVRYFVTKLNEKDLKAIANNTGGRYFNAKNISELRKVYKEINELEKTELSVNVFYNYKEKFMLILKIAVIIFLLELIFRNLILFRVR